MTNGPSSDPTRANPPSDPSRATLRVSLPSGGELTLQNADEVTRWNQSAAKYQEDFGITKVNDLVLVDALLAHGLTMYRATIQLADVEKVAEAQNRITTAASEIAKLEKALGIDKKSREAGGQHDVKDYVERLKRAAHAKGVHVSDRVKAYEALAGECRWKIRLLRNGDDEDRGHHGVSEKSVIDWLEGELDLLEVKDKDWARTVGAVFVGKV